MDSSAHRPLGLGGPPAGLGPTLLVGEALGLAAGLVDQRVHLPLPRVADHRRAETAGLQPGQLVLGLDRLGVEGDDAAARTTGAISKRRLTLDALQASRRCSWRQPAEAADGLGRPAEHRGERLAARAAAATPRAAMDGVEPGPLCQERMPQKG